MSNQILLKTVTNTKYKREPGFVAVYVNNVNFAFSPVDIQMVCGRLEATMDDTQNYINEVVSVIMTPYHAKQVLQAFQKSIEDYEDKHGEIQQPKIEQPPTKEQIVLGSASRRSKK
jgi:hypothetical protein